MDAEQNINIQSKSQESGDSKENPHEVFRQTLETSRQTMASIVSFVTQNGVAPERFSHLTKVFAPEGHVLLPPIETMRTELTRTYGQNDRTMRTRALTARKTGQVFVPEEQSGSVHDIFHESIHRAAWLRDRELGLNTNTTDIVQQLAGRYGVTISADGRVDPNSEYLKRYSQTDEEKENLIQFFTETLKEETSKVTEGLTEWTTQRAEGAMVKTAEGEMAYEDEVRYINDVRSRLKEKEGITDAQADAKVITAALTGDISELLSYL